MYNYCDEDNIKLTMGQPEPEYSGVFNPVKKECYFFYNNEMDFEGDPRTIAEANKLFFLWHLAQEIETCQH